MKVFAIAVLKHAGDTPEPVFLASQFELSSFSFWEKTSAQQLITLFSRTVMKSTPRGKRQTLEHEGHHVHSYLNANGLGATFVTDEEYDARVAFTLLTQLVAEFEAAFREDWPKVMSDVNLPFEPLKKHIVDYQDPAKVDKITKIQKDLDETMEVMHKSIDGILERGTKLDDLVEKSGDLSSMSKAFYKQAKAHNSCCNIG